MMGRESGKTKKTLIVFDFDGTLVFDDGSHEDFSILEKLHDSNIELAIASRNDKYQLDRSLKMLSIENIFTYSIADFRPKSYQVRHILMMYSKHGIEFSQVFFIDDYLPNIERMRNDLPSVHSMQYGEDISSFADILSLVGL